MNGLVSIIIPVYNSESFLNECLNSVINQTYKNIEIILVDDGSTDKSGSICDDYAKKDDRIKVFHKENGGVSSARNLGILHSKGEFITFVDSDDTITKDFITSFEIESIKKNEYRCMNFKNELYLNDFTKYDFINALFSNKLQFNVCGGIFYNEFVRKMKFDVNTNYMEDAIFLTDYIVNYITNVRVNQNRGYNYVNNENSLTKKTEDLVKKIDGYSYSLDKIEQVVNSNKDIQNKDMLLINLYNKKISIFEQVLGLATTKTQVIDILNNQNIKRVLNNSNIKFVFGFKNRLFIRIISMPYIFVYSYVKVRRVIKKIVKGR